MICAGSRQGYLYIPELRVLDGRRAAQPEEVPQLLQAVNTPLRIAEWQKALPTYPDQEFREYLLKGNTQGFRIGFQHQSKSCSSATSNKQSALDNPHVVDEYLSKEVDLGWVVRPLEPAAFPEG